jgi:hypothetical protein
MKNLLFFILAGAVLSGCGQPKAHDSAVHSDTTAVSAAPEPKDTDETDFAVFWTRFRQAALDNNMNELKKRTVFPLKTRGIMDDSPEVFYNEKEFETMFPLFLKSPTGLNADNFNETHADYIAAHKIIIFNPYKNPMMNDNRNASVASMEFENGEHGWKLVFLYLEDDVYNKTGKNIPL